MKRLVILGFVILGFAGGLSTSEAVVDRVVAVVNEEVITLSEVDRMIGPFLKEAVKAEDRLERKEQLNRFAAKPSIPDRREADDYEVKKVGIKGPREVEAIIDDIKKQNKATQETWRGLWPKKGSPLSNTRHRLEIEYSEQSWFSGPPKWSQKPVRTS
jgi:peptidyl-prolyl cis-trans isomerase SurA